MSLVKDEATSPPLGLEVEAGLMITSCTGPGTELETTADQTLIRGLATAFRAFVSGLSSI